VRETELTLGNIDLIKLSQISVADSGYLIKDDCFSLENTDTQHGEQSRWRVARQSGDRTYPARDG